MGGAERVIGHPIVIGAIGAERGLCLALRYLDGMNIQFEIEYLIPFGANARHEFFEGMHFSLSKFGRGVRLR